MAIKASAGRRFFLRFCTAAVATSTIVMPFAAGIFPLLVKAKDNPKIPLDNQYSTPPSDRDFSSEENAILRKVIPSSGELIPAIGMGSWMTFNVGDDKQALQNCLQVLKAFFDGGGSVIDSSPMYGSSEQVIGFCLRQLDQGQKSFSATKVWTPFQASGKAQIRDSLRLWSVEKMDLFQIHNLVSWQKHLETLQQLKADKKLRYIGITTSHGRRHQEIEQIMKTQNIDFIQVTYNIVDRDVESRILPLAREKGIAVIANRPFQRKDLFHLVAGKPLPKWAKEIDCNNWAQYFLKFIISHPDISCAIPATSQVSHMKENMAALTGKMPDEKIRMKMLNALQQL